MTTRQQVSFRRNGLTIAGELFTPDGGAGERLPAVVIGHPTTSVKEQSPANYAQRLADAGYVALTFDASYQGASEGLPRYLEDPVARSEDVKAGVSFLAAHDGVDPDRIGALGICASGGYVPFAAQTDRRIKAVATVSGVNIGDMFRDGLTGGQDPAVLDAMLEQSNQARTAEAGGQDTVVVPMIPMTQEDSQAQPERSLMREAWEYYRTPRAQRDNAPNLVALESFDQLAQFDAWGLIHLIAPRPLLMIAGTEADTRMHAERAIERATGPKELYWIEGASHVDLYDKPEFVDPAVAKIVEFFNANLAVPVAAG